MKRKALALMLILTAIVGIIAFKPSFGWISSVFNKSHEVDLGDLKYSFEGEMHAAYIDESSSEFVAPGENLIYVGNVPGTLKAFNLSTIKTNLRLRIDYTYYDTGDSTFKTVTYGDQTGDFVVKYTKDILLGSSSYWAYDSSEKCWNYQPNGVAGQYDIDAYVSAETTTGEGGITDPPPVGNELDLIYSLGYSDSLLAGNIYEDENVHITLTVEVKQADFVTWSTLISEVYP